jgi:hypothetical protein
VPVLCPPRCGRRDGPLYHELARRQRQLFNRRLAGSHPRSRLGQQLLLVRPLSRASRRAVQAGIRLSRRDKGDRLARLQGPVEPAGCQVIVQRVEPLVRLLAQEVAAEPPGFGDRFTAFAQQVDRHALLAQAHPQAVRHLLHGSPPGAQALRPTCASMVVSITHHRPGAQPQRAARPRQSIPHVRGIGPLLHPNSLFQQRISHGVAPHRHRALQEEPLQVDEPLGRHFRAGPAVGIQAVALPAIVHALVELGHQQRAAHRRLECRDEQPVVAPRQHAADRSHRIPAYPVGHQPLALARESQVPAFDPPKVEHPLPSLPATGPAVARKGGRSDTASCLLCLLSAQDHRPPQALLLGDDV